MQIKLTMTDVTVSCAVNSLILSFIKFILKCDNDITMFILNSFKMFSNNDRKELCCQEYGVGMFNNLLRDDLHIDIIGKHYNGYLLTYTYFLLFHETMKQIK